MARFDIHAVRDGLALDCQSDMWRRMPTRFVVPIEPSDPALIVNAQLNPTFIIDGRSFVMVTQLAGTVRTRDLGTTVISLNRDEYAHKVQRALDLLTTGV